MSSQELQLVQKVELRFALADTDEKFQNALNLYLAPLLLKFSSDDKQVRIQLGKTIKFLLSKINASINLKLPATSLLEQIKHPNVKANQDPTVVQSYTLLFLSKAVSRLSQDEEIQLFPLLIDGISTFKETVSARIFNIICKILESLDDDNLVALSSAFYNLENKNDQLFLIQKFYKFMMLHSVSLTENGTVPNNISQPGLSTADCSFFCYYAGVIFTSSTLSTYKLKILKFIENFKDDDKCLILIVAATDGDSKISSIASTSLKRINIDYEDATFVNLLISLHVGDKGRSSVKPQLQEKILSILCKSRVATKSESLAKISDIGLNSSNLKLKQSTVAFIRWFTTQNSLNDNETDDLTAKKIAHQLKLNLSDIMIDHKSIPNYLDNRRYQYETLGLLLKKSHDLLDVSYIQFLIDMMYSDDPILQPTIQDALTGVTSNLFTLPLDQRPLLKNLIMKIFEKGLSPLDAKFNLECQTRYILIKYVNVLFPFEDIESRVINLLAQSKFEKIETVEEAKRGLNPYLFKINNNTSEDIKFPKFSKTIRYLEQYEDIIDLEVALQFSVYCLLMECTDNKSSLISIDQYWETRVEQVLSVNSDVKKILTAKLSKFEDLDGDHTDSFTNSSLEKFIALSFKKITGSNGVETLVLLTKIISLCPEDITDSIIHYLPFLLDNKLHSLKNESFHYLGQLTGIIGSTPSITDERVKQIIVELLKANNPSSLGFLISRLILRKRNAIVDANLFDSVLDLLETNLSSASTKHIKMSLDCISQLAMFGCLGPNLKLSSKVELFKEKIAERLRPLAQKFDEYAVYTWCYLALAYNTADDDSECLNKFEQLLYETHTTKQSDNLFTAGEGFAILFDGWNSTFMKNQNDLPGFEVIPTNRNRGSIILNNILTACRNTKPSLRKAACIWLLSVVQYCNSEVILERINEIQYAFMRFLSAREEIVQEAASRGLSITYEKGGVDVQETLVHNLLKSFTDSNKTSKDLMSGYMDEETQLFDSGVLNTSDGDSVSTYKDVLNLASEVGNPSLVYKFMSLAKNSALWSSRKGIAFGLGAILDKEKLEDLLKYNPKLSERLIPKLFRYKYDPSPSIARTMNNIWDSLILDNKQTLNQNFSSIKKELLLSMGNREWRVREAGASGLQDLLRQSEFHNYENDLENIWMMAFRSMDDIKASVRKEGVSLTRFLANTMVTKINSSASLKVQESILTQLVPFLLGNNGLLSDSEEVKTFAFDTVMKLVSTCSKGLKPFVANMVKQLILLMSSVEPQVINYLTLNADKYNLKVEDIDSQRLGIVGSSPMMEVIEKLMDLLDEDSIGNFVEELGFAIKSAIGLPSKVAGSKVIVNLILRHFFIINTCGDQLLKIASSQLKDRNETVAKSYAIACGYCIRISSLKKIESFGRKLTKYYFEKKSDSNDDRLPIISSVAAESVSKFANDKFQTVSSLFLPLSFIGKHDLNNTISSNFSSVWSDATSSSVSSIKLYFPEIISLIKSYIGTQTFSLRKTIALSIIEIVDVLDVKINDLNPVHLKDLYQLLLESLVGRTYEGKEKLLDSLVKLSCKSQKFLTSNDELYELVESKIISEAKRNNKSYKKFSIIALGNFLNSYYEKDSLYDIYIEIINSMTTSESFASDNEDSDGDEKMSNNTSSSSVSLVQWKQTVLLNIIHSISNGSKVNSKVLDYVCNETFEFISFTQVNMLPNSDSKFKFKSKIIEIVNKLLDVNENKILQNDELTKFKKDIFRIWSESKKIIGSPDNLQSILVGYTRLTSLIIKELPLSTNEKNECLISLRLLKSENVGSVITVECDKILSAYK